MGLFFTRGAGARVEAEEAGAAEEAEEEREVEAEPGSGGDKVLEGCTSLMRVGLFVTSGGTIGEEEGAAGGATGRAAGREAGREAGGATGACFINVGRFFMNGAFGRIP